MSKKIAITGASGSIGRMIVPRLAKAGVDVVLAGRDPGLLQSLFPGHVTAGYDDLADKLAGCDALLHLAVMNNDRDASEDAFRAANVGFLVRIAEMARAANVPLFINATTVRALDARATDPYTVTKREGEEALAALEGLISVNLRLPAVYGEHFAGRLAFLNVLPGVLRRPVLALASAFRPVVSADRVAGAISGLLDEKAEGEVLVCDPQEQNPAYRVFARGMDLAFAAVVFLLFWWLLALVWLAVRLTSQGPGIFAQPRVGKDEEIFICYKFRTMRQEAPQAGTHEVPASHITQIGRFLRKTKIDELPQIWNLAVGEMSLVGPRPCLPGQTELIEWRRKLGVFRCRPGITGLSQVEGVDMSAPERLARLDARYCALRTVVMDARLVFVTLLP